jgi:lipopolysaccharide transport system permease protein
VKRLTVDTFGESNGKAYPPRGARTGELRRPIPDSDPLQRLVLMWHYRALLQNLVARDLKVRYRNSFFGFAWSLLNPLLMMAVFTIVFTVLLHTAPIGVPFPPFLLVGILAWNYHAISVMASMGSISGNSGLISKVYFPREVLPLSALLGNAVNFLLALIVLVVVIIAFGIFPSLSWLVLPLIVVSQTLFTLGVSLIVSSVSVYFKDIEYIIDTLFLAWFFLTPVFYDVGQVMGQWRGLDVATLVLVLNPMAAYITAYRDVLLFQRMPDPLLLWIPMAIGAILCAVGFATFARLARGFGDVL